MTTETERVVLPDEVEPTKYAVEISTNVKEDYKFRGNVVISLTLKKEVSAITLNSKQLEIHNCVYINAEGAQTEVSETTFDEGEETVTFTFASKLGKGDGSLRIEYTGLHNTEMAGFYRSGYEVLDGAKKTMVSTQLEPLDARRCFPCVDEPARKATFSCTLIVDKGLLALSNMPVISEKEVTEGPDQGRMKYVFDETPKMSTYLLAFCVGEFDYVETTTAHGVLLRVYTPLGKKHLGEFALHVGAETLDLYDGMFGQPFPLPKMDMIAIPEFAMGAMENWGLVTYREVDVLIDSDRASSQQKQRVGTVVAHELAHQWFGNLVTMEWWDDLWLNEGFASWMQNYATNHVYPEWKLWEQFVVETQAMALSLDSLESSHPIQVPIKKAHEVEEVFDIISYKKGGSVVRLIYAYLGHDHFVEGLKVYMEKHQYSNTKTHNLWDAWEEVSKKPINKVMASWTEQMGFPVVTVAFASEPKDGEISLTLEQQWFLADGSLPESGKDNRWAIPMFAVTEAGETTLELFTEAQQTFKVKVGANGWVKLNAGQQVPLRVSYTDEMWESLGEAVKNGKLTVEDRSGLIMDAYALTKAGVLDPPLLLQLLSCYQGESEYAVWEALSTPLSGLNKMLADVPEMQKNFQKIAKSLLLPAFEKVGWKTKSDDGHLGKMLRALLVGKLVTFAYDDANILGECRRMFDAYVKDPKTDELSSDYKTAVFRIVLKNATGSEEYDALFATIDKLESTVEKKAIYLSLGFVASTDLKMKTLEWTTSGVVKKQDFFYAIASVSISGLEGLEMAWKYFKDNFARLDEFLKNASPSLMGGTIIYSASGFTSAEKAEEIATFFQSHPTKMQRKVDQIVESTQNSAKFKDILLGSTEFKRLLS